MSKRNLGVGEVSTSGYIPNDFFGPFWPPPPLSKRLDPPLTAHHSEIHSHIRGHEEELSPEAFNIKKSI